MTSFVTFEYQSNPITQVDKDNCSSLLWSIKLFNISMILATVIPLLGTLITTITGAITVAIPDYGSDLSLLQTIISAGTCFMVAVVTITKNFSLSCVKNLAPTLKTFLTVWDDGTLLS